MNGCKALGGLLLAALFSAAAWAQGDAVASRGAPGILNYVEGQASVGNQTLSQDSIGKLQLQPGESLSTVQGQAEILLTPGSFLRVSDNSTVRMGFESTTTTAAELTKGQAALEVMAAHKYTVLTIAMQNTTTRLVKNGLYEFDADRGKVLVYKGQAEVQAGDRRVKVKDGHELDLNQNGELRTASFDKKAFENSELIQFSGQRSEYLAEANADAAYGYDSGSTGWYGEGWYWDPDFWAYTWIPAGDYCYDAFGWGFYSPWWVVDDPFLFGGFFFFDFDHDHHHHHDHFGHDRLAMFQARRSSGGLAAANQQGSTAGKAPAMANNLGGTAFNHGGAPAFNHGGGGFGGGGHSGGGGGFSSGSHGGGGFGGGGFGGGGFGGGGHR